MALPRRLFYLCCLILGIGTCWMEEIPNSPPDLVETEIKSNCSCGGFPSTIPEINNEPLLSQAPGLVVKCNEEGESTCKSLCFALATATKAKGPEILCNRLKFADQLKLSAFYKVCNKPWTYADMTADAALCCEDSKVKPCTSMDAEHPTTGPEVKLV